RTYVIRVRGSVAPSGRVIVRLVSMSRSVRRPTAKELARRLFGTGRAAAAPAFVVTWLERCAGVPPLASTTVSATAIAAAPRRPPAIRRRRRTALRLRARSTGRSTASRRAVTALAGPRVGRRATAQSGFVDHARIARAQDRPEMDDVPHSTPGDHRSDPE